MRIPTPEEVHHPLNTADPQFVAFIALCAFGGLRMGEAAALKVSDIVNGGAIAIGHPLGASGARIMTTLVNAL